MTRTLTALADRMVDGLVPRATAHAAAACHSVSCYCVGIELYKKTCCDFQPCGPCRYHSRAC